MPLSRRQLSTPAQNAPEPAWPRARRGRLKEPSDSASDAEDDAEARSCAKTKLWRLTPSTRPDLIYTESPRVGSSPRRSSPSAGAAACAVSIGAGRPRATRPPPPHPPNPIPKTTQRRSQAGSSPIRSSPNAGAAAWAAIPRAAAGERLVRPACAIRYRSPRARHQRSSQLLLLPADPLPRVAAAAVLVAPRNCMAALRVRAVGYLLVARGVRPLLSPSPTARSVPRSSSRSSAAYDGCVAAHRTSDAGHRAPLTARDRGQSGAKIELYAAVLSFALHWIPHCWESKRHQQSASAKRV